jgi:hypothetical protein
MRWGVRGEDVQFILRCCSLQAVVVDAHRDRKTLHNHARVRVGSMSNNKYKSSLDTQYISLEHYYASTGQIWVTLLPEKSYFMNHTGVRWKIWLSCVDQSKKRRSAGNAGRSEQLGVRTYGLSFVPVVSQR